MKQERESGKKKSKRTKTVLIFNKQRDLTSIVASIKETSDMLGVTPRSVSNGCKGISTTCKGHYLRYLHPGIKLSALEYFEALDLSQYDEMCGETRYYFIPGGGRSKGRRKIATAEMRTLEQNLKEQVLYRMNEYYAHNLKVLARYGWFLEISPDMYFPELLETKLDDEKRIKAVCKALMNHYRTRLDGIMREIRDRYPKRSGFIKNTVTIYKTIDSRHAILAVLSLVDGICNEKLNRYFFIKEKKDDEQYLPVIVNDLLRVKNDFFRVFVTPILSDCPIFTHQSQIGKYPGQLNRHVVVHGKETDYGSKENFLKSVSLLKYISDMLYFSDLCTRYKKSFEQFILPAP